MSSAPRSRPRPSRPAGVALIALFNAAGWVATMAFWSLRRASERIPTGSGIDSYWERAYMGAIHGFMIADSLWLNVLLLASAVGLWRMRLWGWTAAMMANTIWVYSITVFIVRDLRIQLTPGVLFFTPFAILALISTAYLWQHRTIFWQADVASSPGDHRSSAEHSSSLDRF